MIKRELLSPPHCVDDWSEAFGEVTVTKTEVKEESYDLEAAGDETELLIEDKMNTSEYVLLPENGAEPTIERKRSIIRNIDLRSCKSEEDGSEKEVCSFYKSYVQHMKLTDEKIPYKCELCRYSTHLRRYFLRHLNIHTDRKPHKCDMCGYAAKQKDALKTHVLLRHSGEEKKYKCHDCGYSTHLKASLETHVRTVHTTEKPFRCDSCEFATARKSKLRSHRLVKHNDRPRQYKCESCDYATVYKSNLNKHVDVHSNRRTFKCTRKSCTCGAPCECAPCAFVTVNKSALGQHVLWKHDRNGATIKRRKKDRGEKVT